jgi:hypothetical protein
MEFDRDKLPASIDVAEKAIHQRLRGLPIAHSQEHRELRDALTVSRFSREWSSTFGVLPCARLFWSQSWNRAMLILWESGIRASGA